MSSTAPRRECHRLRKHLKTLQEEIDRGPRVLKAQQARLAAEEQAHKDHHERIKKLKLKQRDDEGTLKQTEARLVKLGQQLLGISVPKEYEAKQSEIRQATDLKNQLEETILATMTDLDARVAAIPEVEKQWADAQADFKQYQVDAADRLARMQADQKESQAALAAAEKELPPNVKGLYDAQVRGRGPDGLAALKGKVCQGCRGSVTDQKIYELQDGGFVVCPNSSCGRLLYPAE
jgi:predicted  nucleic acid-binding Zn-ribbon protein